MGRSNFISPIPRNAQKSFRIWAVTTNSILSCLLLILLSISAWYTYLVVSAHWQIKKIEKSTRSQHEAKMMQTLQHELKAINEELSEIEQFQEHSIKPADILGAIAQHTNSSVQCSHITASSRSVTLEGSADSTTAMMQFVYELQTESLFSSVNVGSLRTEHQHNEPRLFFSIQASRT